MTTSLLSQPDAVTNDRAEFMALCRTHYENFPVGSWLLPARARGHLHRIYAFARTADDIADELGDAEQLRRYRAALRAHLDGDENEVPLFVDLVASVAECALPEQPLFDLLDAFEQDLTVHRYDEPELFDYCRRSADPVGRLVLRVCGYDGPELDRWSDSICTGLQLLNHLQDMREDLLERDRIYFPREDLERFGVDEDDLRASSSNERVLAFVRHWWRRIAELFRAGWPLTEAVRGRLRLELRAIIGCAAAVLERIEVHDFDVLASHVRLRKRDKVRALVRALWSSKPPAVLLR